jgi:hypothetical protein
MKTGQSLNVVASGTGKSIFWNKNMNERLNELAEQARFTWVENDKDITGGVDLEKFAELIVQECQFAIVSRTDLPRHERKLYNNVLKKHFGVEE